jgi:hypothetical protein
MFKISIEVTVLFKPRTLIGAGARLAKTWRVVMEMPPVLAMKELWTLLIWNEGRLTGVALPL